MFDNVQKHLCGALAHFFQRLTNGGEGGVHLRRLRNIVKPDDGNVIGNFFAAFARRREEAQRQRLRLAAITLNATGEPDRFADAAAAAAEMGLAFRSEDGGTRWQRLETGVSGSLWSGLEGAGGEVVLLGMSGRVLVSQDRGDSWQVHEDASGQSLTGAVQAADGSLLVVGAGGLVLRGRERFTAEIRADRQNLAAVQRAADGAVVVAGQLGVERLTTDR